MKIVAIVYAASLLILLLLYLVNHKKSQSSLFRTHDSWYIVAIGIFIVIVAAPIIVLWYPFSLAKSSKQKKEREKSNMEWDKKQAEEMRQRDLAAERYDEALKTRKDECDDEFIDLAHQLQSVVKESDYRSISLTLDRVTVPENASLKVEECKREGMGDESKLYIEYGLSKKNYNVFEDLRFERTCMGAWQAFLLHQIDHYLPLWWHANYKYRDYIYSKDDLAGIHDAPYAKDQDYPDFSTYDLTPTVHRSGNHYFVSCVFWSEFGGLIREYCELVMDDGRLSDFIEFKRDILYEYESGIRF